MARAVGKKWPDGKPSGQLVSLGRNLQQYAWTVPIYNRLIQNAYL
jgi:hypothetical protein